MDLTDELEKLDELVRILVSSAREDQDFLVSFRQRVQQEADSVKKAFIKKAFGLVKEKRIERYIQYHQSALVHLTDVLLRELAPADIDSIHKITGESSRTDVVKFCYGLLEKLLVFIEKHFAKYFNVYAKTPESYRLMVYREIRQQVPHLRFALEQRGVNKRLLAIMLTPLDTFIESVTAQEISYKRIIFLRQLLVEMNDLAAGKVTGKRLDIKVCLTLAYLNYNTHRFFKYCIYEITRLVQEQQTLSQQIEKLSFILKVINQVQEKPGFGFHDKYRSVKDQLSVWVSEEICFFEKRQQLTAGLAQNAEDPVQKEFKLQLTLSVAQLACLLRSLKEIGVIRNNNTLEVIRFMAGVVQTKNTENISWESLRVKFYQVESAARDSVKDLALALFNYTRKPVS